jgi:hypothetical protein
MAEERLPPVKRDDLPASEHAGFDSMMNLTTTLFGDPESSPFTYKRSSDGALVGPFPLFLAAPEAGEYSVGLFGKLGKIPGLPADAKETAILTVGARYQAAYELYAHTNVAIKKVGMAKDVVEAIARGEKPKGLSEGCDVAFDAANYLAGKPGPLPKELWDRSIKTFGKEGTVALMHYVGAYAYTCIVLNAMDAPVPED